MSITQGEKLLSSDIQDLITRLQNELNRRNKTYTAAIEYYIWKVYSEYFGNITSGNENTLTPVNSSLPSITAGTKANASDINKLVAELENINSNDGWSNATAVVTGNLIQDINNISESLERFEKSIDKLSLSGIVSNVHYKTGNTSGCAAACRGLCQSCLGEEIADSGSGGSSCSDACESTCYGGCYGGCIGGCGSGCFATARP